MHALLALPGSSETYQNLRKFFLKPAPKPPEAITIVEGIAYELRLCIAGQHRQPFASSLCTYVISDVTPLLAS